MKSSIDLGKMDSGTQMVLELSGRRVILCIALLSFCLATGCSDLTRESEKRYAMEQSIKMVFGEMERCAEYDETNRDDNTEPFSAVVLKRLRATETGEFRKNGTRFNVNPSLCSEDVTDFDRKKVVLVAEPRKLDQNKIFVLFVLSGGNHYWRMLENTGEFGNWLADFSNGKNTGYEQSILDVSLDEYVDMIDSEK